jgi:valyl-tRNA synthetase
VGETRAAKNELGIAPGAQLKAYVRGASAVTNSRINQSFTALRKLARLDVVTDAEAPQGASIQIVVDEATYVVPLEGVIDIEAERARLTKSLSAAQKEAKSLEGRLANPAFVEKAKPEAVEKARADHADKVAEAQRLEAALARLG